MSPVDAVVAVRHLAAWGLPGGPARPLSVRGASGIASAAHFHRVVGVVLAAIESGGAIDVEDHLVARLRERQLDQLRSDLAVEADLVVVVRALRDAGIPHRVLKGGATAHLDHADPALRSTGDVDVLVPADALRDAHDALADLVDATRTVPDRRRRWTERYGKDRTLALRSGGSLDLHRALAPGFHAIVGADGGFACGERFDVGGESLVALDRGGRLVHAIAHAGYADELRLNSVRDVPLLLGAVGAGWRDVVARHEQWAALLARGVERTWGALPLDGHPIRDWARDVVPSNRERLALRALDLPGSRAHWGALAALPPWRWPGLIGPLVLPSRAYLAHYGRTPFEHLGGTLRRVVKRR